MKRRLLTIIARLSYFTGIDAIFYWLNRKAKRIVTFHNVLPEHLFKPDLTNGVSLSEEGFRFVIREIGKQFNFSTDLDDPRTATITFDDGFLNQYEVAGRILSEEGDIPAIVFVSGDVLGNNVPANAITVEQLLHWTAYAPAGDYSLNGAMFTLSDDASRKEAWVKVVRPAFAADKTSKGRDTLAALDSQAPIADIFEHLPSEYLRLRLSGISWTQIEELRSRGWLIGWHTKSHFPLSSLMHDEKISEITPPTGFRDVVFSYPFGETLSVDSESIRIARECGYPRAVSNLSITNPLCGRYFMPRMSLPTDKYMLHFRLSGAEHFLRTLKLLGRVQS